VFDKEGKELVFQQNSEKSKPHHIKPTNTASGINDTSYVDIDQEISSGVWQSQKMLGSVLKALMLSENIEQISYANLVTKAAANGLKLLKQYYIDDAASGDRLLVVRAATVSSLFQQAIDLATGEVGTYDLGTDTFIGGAGTYTPTLTPDGTVITSTPVVELALYSVVGGVGNVSISMKNIDADFSAGGGTNVGNITIDTLPIPTGSPYFIGSAELKVGASITMPSLPLYASLRVDGTIELYCDDLTFSFIEARITVNFQYPIN